MTISAFHWYVEHDPHEFQQKARGIYSADEWTPRAKSAVRSYGGPRADTEKRPERRQSLDSLSKVFFYGSFRFSVPAFLASVRQLTKATHLLHISSGFPIGLTSVERAVESRQL